MEHIQDTIYALETSLLTPEVRSSASRLDALLADDFTEFGSSGLVYTKQHILERLPATTDNVVYTVSNFETKLLSDEVVMATFKTERVINDGEKSTALRTSLWRNESGTWKLFFHQGTIVRSA